MSLVVVSPHLDDAVFSCGQVIAAAPGSTVVTVFAGEPDDGDVLTMHDEAAGFTNARAATAARRAEDVDACRRLGATAVHLPFVDVQYGQDRPTVDEIRTAIIAALDDAPEQPTMFVPLGYAHHPDHLLTAEACSRFVELWPTIVYAEQPYWHNVGLEAFADVHRSLLTADVRPRGPISAKQHALIAYRSQLAVFSMVDLLRSERYWQAS